MYNTSEACHQILAGSAVGCVLDIYLAYTSEV
jgi:hypothetical protein